MEQPNISRREFFRGAGAAAFIAFASKIEAQEIGPSAEALLQNIESLSRSINELTDEMHQLGAKYGEYFKNETLDQLDETAKLKYGSFLERAETEWDTALMIFSQVQKFVQGTTIVEYEKYGLTNHPNYSVLQSFAELKPTLALLPLQMNIAREALGKENAEYESLF